MTSSKGLGPITLLTAAGLLCLACDRPVEPTTETLIESGHPASLSGVVRFGNNALGSPFPPQVGHDHSTQAADMLVPGTVVINRGGSVTFEIDPVHQAAVYQPGVEPEDIRVDASTLEDMDLGFGIVLPDFRINDPAGRLVLAPTQALSRHTWTTPPGTFDAPGRYLVICTTTPHFVLNRMYGWVIVR